LSNIHSVTPDISVLLSVFNEEKYIVDTITSVLDQTYENFELIIIDDASTDKTLEILKSFNDTRINIFTNNRNIGQTKTLNIGLDKCRGRYIARIDGNDIMTENRLTKQFDYLENNPDTKVVGSFFYLIDELGESIGTAKWPCGLEYNLFRSICGKNPVGHPAVLMEKNVIKEVGKYREEFWFAQDYDLWLRLFERGYLIDNIPEYLTIYREVFETSNIKKNKQEALHRKAFISYIQNIANKAVNPSVLNKYLDFILFNGSKQLSIRETLFVYNVFNYLLSCLSKRSSLAIDKKYFREMFFKDIQTYSKKGKQLIRFIIRNILR